jgi:hypothetical protein
VQVDLLERLGFLERVVVQQSTGQKSAEFSVPKLFTRSWVPSDGSRRSESEASLDTNPVALSS